MSWSERILDFSKSLEIKASLPKGVVVLNPFRDKYSFQLCEQFYLKYYNDNKKRNLILGINPGRLGGGLTGIPFTDPIKLEQRCGIPNQLKKKPELSSDFIYKVIDAIGGPKSFYSQFYISSVSPLGFTQQEKNLNYYDIPKLQSALMPFIKDSLNFQMSFGIKSNKCFVLGEGKNFIFMTKLNAELKLFNALVPLPHPRFIMQYKRKKLDEYVQLYAGRLTA